MTKKDFKAFADTIAILYIKEKSQPVKVKDFDTYLTAVLANDNPRFDSEKWNNYIKSKMALIVAQWQKA
jgi:hypothetical protein